MRVLLISKEGDGLGVAQRLALEGNDVDVYIKDPRFANAGKGLVNRVADWHKAAKGADLVFTDAVGLGALAEEFRGRPFLGSNRAIDTIELDRTAGMKLFAHAGITIPETLPFASKRDVRVPDWNDGWVLKCHGNISTSKTFVVKDEALWQPALDKLPADTPLIAQRIVSGVEVSTEGWFNGRNFVTPFNHTFEEKRFLAGGLGTNTGCMGNVVLAADSNRLTRATVKRIAPFLRMTGYKGPFDINCIVNEAGAYALEATGRMGYDAVEALIEGLDEPAGDLLYEVAAGVKKTMPLTREAMIAVRLSVPPWPFRRPERDEAGEPIYGLDAASILCHVFLTDVMKSGDKYETAAGDGVLLKATAIGRRIGDDYTSVARKRVARTLDAIKVEGKQYRNDIGSRVNGDVAKLKEWGWLKD